MTWFHFCTANHTNVGRATLGDMIAWFEAGLLDLGHTVTLSDSRVESGAINVLWDSFTARSAKEIAASGVTFGIVATEIPDGQGFNWRRDQPWAARYQAFATAARAAAFVWTMIESTVPFYARFCPTAFLPLGFSDRLRPQQCHDAPDIDFSFFGLRTAYREAVVEKLRRANVNVEWPDHFLSASEVEQLINMTKVGLSFKQSAQWPIPSPTRLGRLMLAKRAVAVEHVPVATRQGYIAGVCPPDRDFADYALGILNGGWKRRAQESFERYRDEMPMHSIMEAVLEQTLPGQGGSCASTSNGDRSAIALVREPEAPVIVGVIANFNIVLYAERYIAVAHEDGPIDFAAQDAAAFPLQSLDRCELERRVRNLLGGRAFSIRCKMGSNYRLGAIFRRLAASHRIDQSD